LDASIDEFSELDDKPTDEALAQSLAVADALDRGLVENAERFEVVYRKALSVSLEYCSTNSVTMAPRIRCSN
jgi:hypothetical protein